MSNEDLPVAGINPELSDKKIAGKDAPCLYSFTALCTWYDENFKSVYTEGLSYYVRQGNDKLHAAAKDWRELGMIKIGGSA